MILVSEFHLQKGLKTKSQRGPAGLKEKRDIIDKYEIDNGNDFVKTIFGLRSLSKICARVAQDLKKTCIRLTKDLHKAHKRLAQDLQKNCQYGEP